MTSRYLFFSFTNVRLLCFVSHSNDMTLCQSSSVENVSCKVASLFYHHTVVIQHLVSDTLYQLGDFRLFQRKTYIMLDKCYYKNASCALSLISTLFHCLKPFNFIVNIFSKQYQYQNTD